ncbi:MAG: TrkA family potassium uptake protein [Oscillospiraceae bacterium]|jgi:trk system potassium uptake protein TrkA|nr:TrkA family potassium uptake protein [Oscillospiraceae bacterium]
MRKSYIVIGLGRFGSAVAEELMEIGNEVLAIDENEEKVGSIADRVTHSMVCDAKDEEVMRSIGVRNFDCAIVGIGGNIEDSVLVTLLLKDMGMKTVICKAKNENHKRVLERVGADRVLIPERDMGKRLAQTMSNASMIDYIELSEDYSIIECSAPSDWAGKSIGTLNIRARYGITVLAAHNRNRTLFTASPSAEYIIDKGDILVLIGKDDDLTSVTDGKA